MKKLIKIQAGQSKIIEGKTFEKEKELQEIVKNHPELIPLDELGEDVKPILIIGREFSLGEAGLVDLLGIDVNGLLTIIEFKLEKNTLIREAVAQTLEYAANLWGMPYPELEQKCLAYFRSDRCTVPELKPVRSLEQALAWHHRKTTQEGEIPFDGDEFKEKVAANLSKGEFRLILFCDEVDSRTKKAVEYVHTLSHFDFYCASAEFFDDAGIQFIRPIMVTKEREDKQTEKRHAGKISYDDFIKTIPGAFQSFVPVYERFVEMFDEIAGKISWGTKGFAAYFPASDKGIRLFEAYPADIWIITKVGLEKYGNMIPLVARQDYEASMKEMSHFKKALITQGKLCKIKYSDISPADLEHLLKFCFDWHKKWFVDVKEIALQG